MATVSKPSPLTFSLFLFLIFSTTNGLFLKLPLLHKHPYPNPTPSHILSHDTTRISLLRRQNIKSPVTSAASYGTGQYLVALHLGTPPQRLLLVADTGSDLIWVRCSACNNCSHHLPGSSFSLSLSVFSSDFHFLRSLKIAILSVSHFLLSPLDSLSSLSSLSLLSLFLCLTALFFFSYN